MAPTSTIQAVYEIRCASGAQAERAAREIAYEQTVEIDEDLVTDRFILEQVVGRVREVERAGDGVFRARIEYPSEVAAGQLPQLLNVLFGDISIQRGIRLVDFDLPEPVARAFGGPRFGIEGIRRLAGVARGPLLCTALKPMGLPPDRLARLAEGFARGGISIVKDDHGLADHSFCPFEERVRACAQAVRRANEATGRRTLYFPNLIEPSEDLGARARLASDLGADGLLVSPFLVGLDRMRALASNPSLPLPLMAHPSFAGPFIVDPTHGMDPGVLLGSVLRLAGADIVIYPNAGGRFPLDEAACSAIADRLRASHSVWKPAFPAPAGGMSLKNVPAVRRFYGDDVVLIVGSSLYRQDGDPEAAARVFRRLAEEPADGDRGERS